MTEETREHEAQQTQESSEKAEAQEGKKSKPEELKESAQKIWFAGLGALAMAEEEGSKLFQNLVSRGEAFAPRAKRPVENVRTKTGEIVGKVETRVEDSLTSLLGKLGIPSRGEIASLAERVANLTEKLETMKSDEKKSPGKASTKTGQKTAAAE